MMHIFSMKEETKKGKIQPLADAPLLYISLTKYLDSSPKPIVNIGDKVKKYQLIGLSSGEFSSNVHAPVSGIILDIKEHPLADGTMANTIIIENDFLETEVDVPADIDYTLYSSEQLLELIKEAGIVGEGGAQFPTAAKYTLDGKKINTFIINGTECEPYLTADYALMSERTEELFKSINLINKILEAEDIVISIEEQNKELLDLFYPLIQQKEYNKFRVVILSNEYPQGGELQVIKSVTGIEIPRSTRPRDAGVIVSNVGTVYAIYQAIVCHKPVISRIVTISGERSSHSGNYEVKIGTPIGHIINQLGLNMNNKSVVLGGPMMGKAVTDWTIPITKGAAGILFMKKEKIKRNNCISCGYCIEVCPMHLMPMKFEENYRRGKYFNLEKYSLSSCIECAACEYICPSNVPLIESIKEGKIKLKQLVNAI